MCKCCAEAKVYFAVTSILSVILIFQIYWLNFQTEIPEIVTEAAPPQNETTKRQTKYILYWNGGSKQSSFFKEGSELFESCKIKDCFVTVNKSTLAIDEYDAIIFDAPNYTKMNGMPAPRKPNQRYIYHNTQAPPSASTRRVHFAAKNFYNWTMTYRLDSDIPTGIGHAIQRKTKYQMPKENFLKSRKKSVAWLASDCSKNDTRKRFAKKLDKYISVDVYGSCGDLSCPKEGNCYGMLEKNYKFILSFESYHCRDYISDTFFKVLQRNLIPIIYGGGNYIKVAPPHSYINVENFKSPERLANYLKYLETDLNSYLLYFQWKKSHKIDTVGQSAACTLCKMLTNQKTVAKTYGNIDEWWFGTNNYPVCRTNEQLPKVLQ